ncbi:MAG: UDP-glucose--hexose-1-phosphate uridylyltransferase [Oscillospiraceae bacterium]|nr:UDP-glucose--hexose-1-phosphate uridylyltransferase [Oscillospiraceae bacterium]
MELYVKSLVAYAVEQGLLEECDTVFAINRLLEVLQADSYEEPADAPLTDLEEILRGLLDYAVEKGILDDNITARDLFDTKLMGAITPFPHEVRKTFAEKYARDPKEATDYYYAFSQATDYIRRYRIQKDRRWKYASQFGEMDITINLSKPEKDPRAVAAAKLAPQTGYPKCQLCTENEGYAGRMNHPARQNHRILPITIDGGVWYWQYSPYVYYNEHCIVFNGEHTPMKIDRSAFRKLLDFVGQFPHYFVGSNADLPIVGGSILSHEHFQGGGYDFAMAKAPVEEKLTFRGYEDISAGIVAWPMSVIRLEGSDPDRLVSLADDILTAWRGYTDESAFIFAHTDGEDHNTITPIARMRGDKFQLDLVLRNNITTEEHPLGVYHPHAEYHHIKKENIGLIEVMGLAVLPARLAKELDAVKELVLAGKNLRENELTEKHATWMEEILSRREVTAENISAVVEEEVGYVFSKVLECAGVYKRTEEGKAAFLLFTASVKG